MLFQIIRHHKQFLPHLAAKVVRGLIIPARKSNIVKINAADKRLMTDVMKFVSKRFIDATEPVVIAAAAAGLMTVNLTPNVLRVSFVLVDIVRPKRKFSFKAI